MYIKIFCGGSQKYLLLESKNVTLDKRDKFMTNEEYRLFNIYLRLAQDPFSDDKGVRMREINDKCKELDYSPIEFTLSDLFTFKSYSQIKPVLSDEEERDLVQHDDKIVGNHKMSIIEIDGVSYITTGNIYVMNEAGQTIDKI